MLKTHYQHFKDTLLKTIPAHRIITNPLQLLAYGTDASFYRLIPKIIIRVHSEEEAVEVITQAGKLGLPITYRAAGTSLSGQASTDSILMIATHKWRQHTIMDAGEKIRLQPGIIGGKANKILAPFGRKIGPDPATINVAMIGGIVSNNASGMCCGTHENSYKTIADVRLIFYDGTILDTSDEQSKIAFQNKHPEIIHGVETLRDEIKQDQTLFLRIQQKFKIKNTTGYGLNAFVDFEDPFDIIKHLVVGSEGTLTFISDVTFNTVTDEQYKACALLIFETIELACQAIPLLKQSPVAAAELLDRDSIRSVEHDPEAPDYFRTLPETACVLLVEIQADDQETINDKEHEVRTAIESIPTLQPYRFTSDPQEYNFNWKARKGLLPTVGGLRPTGTTCLIEDVAFPIEHLAAGATALKILFKKYEYQDAVLFGHALDGNLHLTFSQDFNSEKEVQRYSDLMEELAEIVVDRFDGSLKAEHGTGRNMAAFVEKEWGKAAYTIMKRIKSLFDPHNLINPGVLINDDPKIHLKNLKPLPAVDALVDTCIECGFCEPYCVSEGLTLSPRHRIVIGREIAHLEATGNDPKRLRQMKKDATYFVDQTCATDGLCSLGCPMKIDTGRYVKEIRYQNASGTAKNIARYIGNHMAGTTAITRQGLNTTHVFHNLLGDAVMHTITAGVRTVSFKKIPQWNPYLPKGATKITRLQVNPDQPLKVVYLPSCISRIMGTSKGYDKEEVELRIKTEQLLTRAGYTIIYPDNLNALCCGMSFSSKGYKEEGARKAKELEQALFHASEQGTYPILFDMSPCFLTFKEMNKNPALKIFDPVEFMLDHVLSKLTVKNPRDLITVFPVCSVKKGGLEEKLQALAKICARQVVYVENNCCGFAGDKGFSVPELNAYGQRHLQEQIPAGCTEGFSTSRTCEIGMSKHSQITFKSIFYLLDEVTR